MRFIAANTHPDHDTIAVFRRTNTAAFEAAFLHVLLRVTDQLILFERMMPSCSRAAT